MPAQSLKNRVKTKAYRLVLGQLGGVLALSLIIFILKDKNSALSVLLGGLAYTLPNLIFVCFVFRYVGAREMGKFLAAFMGGEALKLLLSAILFLMIVKTVPVSLLFTLVGWIGAIVSFWITSFRYVARP